MLRERTRLQIVDEDREEWDLVSVEGGRDITVRVREDKREWLEESIITKQGRMTSTEKDAPKVQEPKEDTKAVEKKDKPKKEKKPKADKPKEDKPKTDKPKEDKPKADKPKADKPKADKPKEDKPKEDKPKEEKRKVKKGKKGEDEKKGEQKKEAEKKKSMFVIDCTLPVKDKVFQAKELLEHFLNKIKVENKCKNLGKAVTVTCEDGKKIRVNAEIPLAKRYLKYLAKKFLKKQEVRDYLRLVAPSKSTYEFKYFKMESGE